MADNNEKATPTGPRQEAPPRAAESPRDNAIAATPAKAPWPWREVPTWFIQRPWPVLLFAGLFVLAYLTWSDSSCLPECGNAERGRYVLPMATLTWIVFLFAWFVDCFTGDPFEKRTKAIEFSYFFMVLSFCLVAIMIADIGQARKFGVVEGCVENLSRGNVMPIQCDYPRDMWSDAVREAGKTDEQKAAEATKALEARKAAEAAQIAAGGSAGMTGPVAGGGKAADKAAKTTSPEHPDYPARKDNYLHNHNYHYLLNIGGRLDRLDPPVVSLKANPELCTKGTCQTQAVYAVRGGLPVPVYFIVLALIGGAISLAKNVPGIQKRSDVGWEGTAAEPRLTPGEVREILLFQVLQFVTAPMLAVIAYHTIKPESSGSTVALGFVVGFGSDQILQLIRSMVKGTQGSAGASPLTMGIQGKVVRGAAPVSAAKVTLEGTTKEARTDAKGEFVISGVPVRADAYVVKIEAGDQTQVRRVKADEPKTVDLATIDMARAANPAAPAPPAPPAAPAPPAPPAAPAPPAPPAG